MHSKIPVIEVRTSAGQRRIAVLVGAVIQFVLVASFMLVFNLPMKLVPLSGLAGGLTAGFLLSGPFSEGGLFGGFAVAVGIIAFFTIIALQNLVVNWQINDVFAPLIIFSIEFVYAAFLVPVAMVLGGVGGWIGRWLSETFGNPVFDSP